MIYLTRLTVKDLIDVSHAKLVSGNLLDEIGETSVMYGAFALPTTIIIDREGKIVHEILGSLDEALLDEYIEPLL